MQHCFVLFLLVLLLSSSVESHSRWPAHLKSSRPFQNCENDKLSTTSFTQQLGGSKTKQNVKLLQIYDLKAASTSDTIIPSIPNLQFPSPPSTTIEKFRKCYIKHSKCYAKCSETQKSSSRRRLKCDRHLNRCLKRQCEKQSNVERNAILGKLAVHEEAHRQGYRKFKKDGASQQGPASMMVHWRERLPPAFETRVQQNLMSCFDTAWQIVAQVSGNLGCEAFRKIHC